MVVVLNANVRHIDRSRVHDLRKCKRSVVSAVFGLVWLRTEGQNIQDVSVVNLAPANYKVRVTASGFSGWVGVLTLRFSQAALVNASMNAATVSTNETNAV